MCIIVAKKKDGNMPSMDTFKTCFDHNHDGAGFMFVKDDMVHIEKGFMTWEAFSSRLTELRQEYNDFNGKSFVAHFRIGTQGKNDEHTCHPFPISSKYKYLRKTVMDTDIGMVHNGILRDYGSLSRYARLDEKNKVLSDTQLFIKYCVNSFKSLNRNFYKNPQVIECLAHISYGSKLCFLDKEDNLYMTGDFVEDNGTIYSNTTYKPYAYTYSSSNYIWRDDYDSYDDWYMTCYRKQKEQDTNQSNSKEEQITFEDDFSITDFGNNNPGTYFGDWDCCLLTEAERYVKKVDENAQIYLNDGFIISGADGDYYYDDDECILYELDKTGMLNSVDYAWLYEDVISDRNLDLLTV